MSSSTHTPGAALVAESPGADPVTRLVLGWLADKRSENTRTAYARDIGITPRRRVAHAPSWLAWCRAEGVHPVTGVTGLHVALYARRLAAAELSPASAARKLTAGVGLVCLAGPARAHRRQPGTARHRPSQARRGQPGHPGPDPRSGSKARPRGRHGSGPAAGPHLGAGRDAAVHWRPGLRGNRRRRRGPRHRAGPPGAAGHPRRR